MLLPFIFSFALLGAEQSNDGVVNQHPLSQSTVSINESNEKSTLSSTLSRVKKEMNTEFFQEHLHIRNLKRVIALAEIEDFDNQSFPIITETMAGNFRKSLFSPSPFYEAMRSLENQIFEMDDEGRSRGIEKWRGTFLDAVTAYRRHLASLPPYWRHLILGSLTHDSNVNRVATEAELPAIHNGKDDLQFYFMTQSTYRPFVRGQNPKLWLMKFGLSSILHNEFDENDLFGLKVENQFSIDGTTVDRWTLGISSQWMNAKSLQSESFESSFQRHSLKLGLELDDFFVEALSLKESLFKLNWTESRKSHFKNSNSHRDARESRIHGNWVSRLGGPWGLNLSSSFREVKTENNPSADHKSWAQRIGLTWNLKSALGLKQPLSLSLGASSHQKRFDNFLGGQQEEKWLVWRFDLKRQISSTIVMVGMEILEKEDTITTDFLAPIQKDARQVRTTFSLARMF